MLRFVFLVSPASFPSFSSSSLTTPTSSCQTVLLPVEEKKKKTTCVKCLAPSPPLRRIKRCERFWISNKTCGFPAQSCEYLKRKTRSYKHQKKVSYYKKNGLLLRSTATANNIFRCCSLMRHEDELTKPAGRLRLTCFVFFLFFSLSLRFVFIIVVDWFC